MIEGKTIAESAADASVTERTLHNWLSNPDFCEALEKLSDQVLAVTVNRKIRLIEEAFDVCEEIIGDSDAANRDRLKAASLLFDTVWRWQTLKQRAVETEQLIELQVEKKLKSEMGDVIERVQDVMNPDEMRRLLKAFGIETVDYQQQVIDAAIARQNENGGVENPVRVRTLEEAIASGDAIEIVE